MVDRVFRGNGKYSDKPDGRGPTATLDMKLRIQALRAQGKNVVEELWWRHVVAEVIGEGYTYEFAEEAARPGPVPLGSGRA